MELVFYVNPLFDDQDLIGVAKVLKRKGPFVTEMEDLFSEAVLDGRFFLIEPLSITNKWKQNLLELWVKLFGSETDQTTLVMVEEYRERFKNYINR